MKRAIFPVVLVLASVASGCGSYKDDLYKLCNAQKLSGAEADSGLAGVATWLSENLKTKKSRELLKSAAEHGSLEELRAEAAANGVTPCPLVDPDLSSLDDAAPAATATAAAPVPEGT